MMMMGTSPNHHVVLTASQWEELEQQALIYKYIVSGVPIPDDLIVSVRRSLYNNNNSSSSSALISNQPTSLWEAAGSFQYSQLYGYGRKIDLEPGRCRRTDGKKWRCSKEAYPDSKYCERHMHRGRNRSRKPVESSFSSSTTTPLNNIVSSSSSLPSTTTISKLDPYPPFSSVHSTTFMDSSSSFSPHQTLKDYRNLQGMKDLRQDDHQRSASYFQLNDPYTSATQRMSSDHHFNFQNLKDQQKKEEDTQGQHCFVMGTDFIKPSPEEATKKVDHETTSKQPFHHFFSPTNPNHDPNNWADHQQQLPKPPLSTQDLFQSKPRPNW